MDSHYYGALRLVAKDVWPLLRMMQMEGNFCISAARNSDLQPNSCKRKKNEAKRVGMKRDMKIVEQVAHVLSSVKMF